MADSRTYIKLDDHIGENPKIVAAGDEAAWLYVQGLCYCSRQMTDGFIPKVIVNRLVHKGGERLARVLIREQLWEDNGDKFYVPDYLEHQRSRREIEELREAKRQAGALGGAASAVSRRLKSGSSKRGSKTNPEAEAETKTELTTPLPPTSGGSRAEGTNPRALAMKRERDRILDTLNDCSECGDNPNVWCSRCTGLRRKLSDLSA